MEEEIYRYDVTHPDSRVGHVWESGFESYDDAYDAMCETLTNLIDEFDLAEEEFDWEVRQD